MTRVQRLRAEVDRLIGELACQGRGPSDWLVQSSNRLDAIVRALERAER